MFHPKNIWQVVIKIKQAMPGIPLKNMPAAHCSALFDFQQSVRAVLHEQHQAHHYNRAILSDLYLSDL